MRTAVIYARYSSDSQTEQSIEGQLRVCEEYAKSHDLLVLDTYIDRAMTGTNDNRPDFQRMIKDSAKRQFEVVLVYKLDRFSRDKYATAVNKNILKNHGVKVVSATESIPETPEGIILESMLEGYAEYYSVELSQKIRRGNYESRKKGNLTGGRVPYGYKNENKKAVIVEHEAEVIRYIYEQFSIGVYIKDIIALLTARGILYCGKPFIKNTVYKILRNERYSGTCTINGEVFDNLFPRIVPQELFDKVRSKVELNKYGKRSVEVVYLLRHKLKCGYCGQPVSADSGTSMNGEVKHYYKCLGRKRGSKCQQAVIRKDVLEQLIIDAILERLRDKATMKELVSGLMAIQEQQIKDSPILNVLLHDKQKTDTALKNLVAAIEQGIISNTTNKRLHELERQQEELERQIAIERSKQEVKLSEEAIREFYEQALRLEPQTLITYLIKEIVLYNDHIDIYFNNPLTTSPDDNQGFSFYSNMVVITYKVPQRSKPAILRFEVVMRI